MKDELKASHLINIQEAAVSDGLEITLASVQITQNRKSAIVIGVYRPPNAKVGWFQSFNSLLLQVCTMGHTLILGDLNSDLMKPKQYPGKELLKSLKLSNTQVAFDQFSPTRITGNSATCLDIIAIDKELVCLEYNTSPIATSDHFPVTATIQGSATSQLQPVIRRSFTKINYRNHNEKINSITLSLEGRETSPNCLLKEWYEKMNDVLDDLAPLRAFPARKHKSPWLTEHIKGLMTRRDWLAKQLSLESNTHDQRTHIECQLKIARKRVKSNIRHRIKSAGEEALATNDHKNSWSFIKAATFSEKKSKDKHYDLESLNNYFSDVVNEPNTPPLNSIQSCSSPEAFQIQTLAIHDTERLLKSTKTNTASGCDDLPGFLLKRLATAIAPNLTLILNNSISNATFPSLWKHSNVCAVWKGKGSRKDPQNYRPISIIPVVARVFEKAVASQLYQSAIRIM